MKASPQEQQLLLQLQEFDTKLAKLSHTRRTLPLAETVKELETRAADLHRVVVTTGSELADSRRELKRIELDVEQVANRLTLQRSRLEGGQVSPKELSALQHEIDQMMVRQSGLEDSQLEAMENLETIQKRIAAMEHEEAALREDVIRRSAERDAEFERIDAEISPLQENRAALATEVNSDLLEEYEIIRGRTGGVGAVAVRGHQVEGFALEFSPAQWHQISSAPADEVLISDEYEYILVRIPEK